jgi:hypothetical protein
MTQMELVPKRLHGRAEPDVGDNISIKLFEEKSYETSEVVGWFSEMGRNFANTFVAPE